MYRKSLIVLLAVSVLLLGLQNVVLGDGDGNTSPTGVALSTVVESNSLWSQGGNISITGGEYSYLISDNPENWSGWTSAPGSSLGIEGLIYAKVRQTSSASYSTTTYATLTIGGVSKTFSVTTIAAPGSGTVTTTPSGGNQAQINSLNKQINSLNKKIAKLNKQLKTLKKQLKKAAAKKKKAIKKKIAGTNKQIKSAKKKASALTKQVKALK